MTLSGFKSVLSTYYHNSIIRSDHHISIIILKGKSMNISPKATVEVQEDHRTKPAYKEAFAELKKLIHDDGFCSGIEFKECATKHQISEDLLLQIMRQEGYGFVKSDSVSEMTTLEVLVDLRFLAAAMLLIYSDHEFASSNSVLKCAKIMHLVSTSEAAFPITCLGGLLSEIYTSYGHHFSFMAVAEKADLSTEDESKIIAFAERHKSAMDELAKHDTELTAVFHLCLAVMHLVNNGKADEKLLRTFHDEASAYNHFWKAACKVRDTALGDKYLKNSCGNCDSCGCDHNHTVH